MIGSLSRWRQRHIIRKSPEQSELGFLAGAFIGAAVERVRSRLCRDQWFLAVRPATPGPAGFQFLVPDAARFYADPFLHRKGDRHFVFFEEMVFGPAKGRISVAEILKDGSFSAVTPVLERPYHLSYPFVFDWRGETFMVPESCANGTIELYRAREYPYVWQQEMVLLSDISAVDATLWELQGRWWMFVNVALPGQYICDFLNVYSSISPLGDWRAHPRNPVVHDRGGSRPAGSLFMMDGRIIRPAQDCSRVYGGAIVLKRLEELTESSYCEVEAGRIEPSIIPGASRVHTMNRNDRWEVYDGFRWAWGPRKMGRPG